MGVVERSSSWAPPAESWLRERLEALTAYERGSASEGERRAAEWLVGELARAGAREARIEVEPGANGTYWWSLGLLAGAGALAGVLGRDGGLLRRATASGLGAAACALAAAEMPPGRRPFRRLLPSRPAHHVLAELGPAGAERTIVLMAHHDAAHSAFFFNPAITEAVDRRAPWVFAGNDTSPPLMWPVIAGPGIAAAGAALGSRALAGLGALVSAGTAATMAHIGASEVVPGANDNGTACVTAIALARALAERPTESTRVLVLSTSEEALCEGMGMFMDRHGHELPLESTFFLCVETIGSPQLTALRGEGMIRMREYPAESLALVDSTAEQLGIELMPNLRLRNATDAVVPLARGYQCISLCSVNRLKNPANYHWRTDTADNVDYATLRDGIRLVEAIIRSLDREWIQPRGP
jgi:hypothetical protein